MEIEKKGKSQMGIWIALILCHMYKRGDAKKELKKKWTHPPMKINYTRLNDV